MFSQICVEQEYARVSKNILKWDRFFRMIYFHNKVSLLDQLDVLPQDSTNFANPTGVPHTDVFQFSRLDGSNVLISSMDVTSELTTFLEVAQADVGELRDVFRSSQVSDIFSTLSRKVDKLTAGGTEFKKTLVNVPTNLTPLKTILTHVLTICELRRQLLLETKSTSDYLESGDTERMMSSAKGTLEVIASRLNDLGMVTTVDDISPNPLLVSLEVSSSVPLNTSGVGDCTIGELLGIIHRVDIELRRMFNGINHLFEFHGFDRKVLEKDKDSIILDQFRMTKLITAIIPCTIYHILTDAYTLLENTNELI